MKFTAKPLFTRVDLFILPIILVIAFILRSYNLNVPLADFHSWRQADTSAVTRNYVKNGINLLKPTYDDLSNVQSGKENPEGLRYVEFPLYNAIVAELYNIAPYLNIEEYGRLVTVISSLIVIAIIYYLVLKEAGRIAAVASASIYSVFPFFVYFSRVVLPETTALMFTFLSIYFLYLYTQEAKNKLKLSILYVLAFISFACGLLVKPTVIFYGITLFFLFIRKYEFNLPKKIQFYAFFLLAGAPLLWWRNYILQFPAGVPSSEWLITSVNTSQGLQNIFFRPAYFRWIFFERINNIIYGGYLTFFGILGIVQKYTKYLIYSIYLSAVAYLLVFQGGNVQHEYYQTLIFPALAIGAGTGIAFAIHNVHKFNQIVLYPAIVVIILFSLLVSYDHVQYYYGIPSDLVRIAQIVSTLTQENDKIVTDRTGDTTLLYLMNRKGAPAVYKDPAALRDSGYNYLETENKGMIDSMKASKFQVVFENDKFALFKL